jgi:aldehyde dehydrogenase (NAD+)
MERRQDELVRAMMEEAGGTIGISMFQMFFVPGLYRMAASAAYDVKGEIIPADHKDSFFMAIRQPAGVVSCFGPFNVPYILCSRAFAVPVAYGNTAVLKPSEEAPVTGGILLAEIFEEAGLPPGVLNVITSTREDAVEVRRDDRSSRSQAYFVHHSTEVGAHRRKAAASQARHARTGRQRPLIILPTTWNTPSAPRPGAFTHQPDLHVHRTHIIEKKIADKFTEKFKERALALPMGDPTNPATAIGPLINQRAVDLVHAHVQEAVAGGAELVCGGQYDNLVYHPTIVTDVKPDMRIFTDQTFGPVAPIIVVNDAEEALAVANNSKYGLSSGILTKDFTRALDIAMRLETGMVHIGDQTVNDEPQAPFGGVKGSGYGRFGGQAALDEFTELRWINVQRTPRTFP